MHTLFITIIGEGMQRYDKNRLDSHLVDPEILALVKDLNSRGYTTSGSCAGHKGERGGDRGEISFKHIIPISEYPALIHILERFGCKRIKIDVDPGNVSFRHPTTGKMVYGVPATYISFSPIGEPWKTWKQKRPKFYWEKYYGG